MRQTETNILRIFRLPEGSPLVEGFVIEDFGQISGAAQLREPVEIEHGRTTTRDKRRMSGRGHAGHLLYQVHVLGMPRNLVVADQRAKWLAAERAELFFINLLEN